MNIVLIYLRSPGITRVIPLQGAALPLTVGRQALLGGADWPDRYLSRQHFKIWQQADGRCWIARVAADKGPEKTPLFLDADRTLQAPEPCALEPGAWLYLGRNGQTAITLGGEDGAAAVGGTSMPAVGAHARTGAVPHSPFPWVSETAMTSWDDLPLDHRLRKSLKVLQEELPRAIDTWMSRPSAAMHQSPKSGDEEQLFDAVAGVLRLSLNEGSLPSSPDVAFLGVDAAHLSEMLEPPGAESLLEKRGWRCLNSDPSLTSSFRASRRVLTAVMNTQPGELELWHRERVPVVVGPDSLEAARHDWVLAMQLKSSGVAAGEAPAPLVIGGRVVVLYVACSGVTGLPTKDIHPFLRSVCLQVASLLDAREQMRKQLQLSRYFSPQLRRYVNEVPPEDLKPMIFTCSVLFCDRRGSSMKAETAAGAGDQALLAELHRNNDILGKVAAEVFQNNGAVADFAGDGVLAFWGWPPAEGQHEHAAHSIKTAMRIASALSHLVEPDPEFLQELAAGIGMLDYLPAVRGVGRAAFRIGISTGRMAVGNVGLDNQMKVGVFGDPVNLGARLEGMGKMFHLPVIISEETARMCGTTAGGDGPAPLLRRLGRVRPAGFNNCYPVYELVLPWELGGSGASPGQIQRYAAALEHFEQGRLRECVENLRPLLQEGDTGSLCLLEKAMAYLVSPPPRWAGEIVATSK